MTGGRPLRFLALALGGWVVIRIAVLLPEIDALPVVKILPRMIGVLVPGVAATGFARLAPVASSSPLQAPALPAIRPPTLRSIPAASIARWPAGKAVVLPAPATSVPQVDRIPSPLAPPTIVRGSSRLNGSAWLLVRGGPGGTLSGGQLGASQGGIRVTYALGERRRLALAARVAAPLKGRGREVALGIEWQPTDLPIRLIAERRFVLDGGRGGPTVGVIAGYGPSDVAPGVRIEAYGQGGAIARDGVEGFVDASARLTHPIGSIAGARVDIGIGAWGSAQRTATRVDIGPSIVATLPVAHTSLRVMLDWRERIAGDARPGSGPALSIGTDF
jgi:hypothetical protein